MADTYTSCLRASPPCPRPATIHYLLQPHHGPRTRVVSCDAHTGDVLTTGRVLSWHRFVNACATPNPRWRDRAGTSFCEPR